MDLNAVELLITVVDRGSFRAAASALAVPRSTLSRKLAELEAELGVQLLARNTRMVRPTEAGLAFLEQARPGVAALHAARRVTEDLQASPRGPLRISVALGFAQSLLPSVLVELRKRHPELRVAVDVSERRVRLVEDGYDLAVRAGRLDDSTLVVRRLMSTAIGIYGSPEYLAGRDTPTHPRELSGHDCIAFASTPSTARWELGRGRRATHFEFQPVAWVNNMSAAAGLALSGLGLAQLPEVLVRADVEAGRLVELLPAYRPADNDLSVLYPGGGTAPPKVRAFVDVVVEQLRRREGR